MRDSWNIMPHNGVLVRPVVVILIVFTISLILIKFYSFSYWKDIIRRITILLGITVVIFSVWVVHRTPPRYVYFGNRRVYTSVTSLSVDISRPMDIYLLRYFTNLRELSIYGQIYSFEPLSNIRRLTKLRVPHATRTNNIRPLRNLTNLTVLYLPRTGVRDITPLENLTNLTELTLAVHWLDDMTPLKNLINLTYLNLWSPRRDFTSLAYLTNLTHLTLRDFHITDITPLENLVNLTNLQIYGMGYFTLYDLTPLANLTNLTYLVLFAKKSQ